MEQLLFEVKELIDKELKRAEDKFGAVNNSDHESYAVLLEEWEEFVQTLNGIEANLNRFWEAVKTNCSFDTKTKYLLEMKKFVESSLGELIQVAAMVKKAKNTISYNKEVSERGCQ